MTRRLLGSLLSTLRQWNFVQQAHSQQHAFYATAAKANKSQKTQKPNEERADSRLSKWLAVLQPGPVQPASFSESELQARTARAQEYSRRKMAVHRLNQQDLVNKIALKQAALAALPSDLHAEASREEWVEFPMNRQRPYMTPPTQGPKQKAVCFCYT